MPQRSPAIRSPLGLAGEAAAAALYRRRGFRVVARNWRCHAGEVDLVVVRGGTVVFCEVKTRAGDALGGPFEAVTPRKQRKLRQLAEIFLLQQPVRAEAVRFDVASVRSLPGSQRHQVEIFEDAF